MFTPAQLPCFHHTASREECARDTEKNKMWNRVWSTKQH